MCTQDRNNLIAATTRAMNSLIEHADTIVILASGTDGEGNTFFYKDIRGNSHAAEGTAREYIRQIESYQHGFHSELGRQDRQSH